LKAFAAETKTKLNVPGAPAVWPEDQLKTPLDTLLTSIGTALGVSVVVRTEAPRAAEEGDLTGGSRVDAAVSVGPEPELALLTGHVELKAPGKGGDPTRLRNKADKEQWAKFKKLPNLIYTDGREWTLQRTGTRSGPVFSFTGDPLVLGADAVTEADASRFELLVRNFLTWAPIVPATSRQLADLLAPLCRLLRTEAKAALDTEGSALSALAAEWRKYLFPGASNEVVADAYAQTFTYALLIARFEGADPLTVEAAEETLHDQHGLLGEVLGLLNNPAAHSEVRTSTDLILRVMQQVKPSAITKRNAENPWLYFYEEFLAAYDPSLRKKVGAYYTPAEVVRAQTSIVRSLLVTKFGKTAAFADPDVVTLDPAVGTGTYPLGILESVAANAPEFAPAAIPQLLRQAAANMYGIEYLIGPYSVAHLRLSRFLADHGVTALDGEDLLKILLADTLASHEQTSELTLPDVFGYENISHEREEARELKVDTRVVVCMGNPPYLRGKKTDTQSGSSGGWVTMRREPIAGRRVRDPETGRLVRDRGEVGVISDFIAPAVAAGRGGDVKNLYNAYVYFWRWALWKVFEQEITDQTNDQHHGIVSFITASSYLRGPGFVGMRQHMRSLFDELWIIDLGGDNKGGRRTENVFSIETPVAIATGVRYGAPNPDQPATVHYASLADLTAAEKRAVLGSVVDLNDARLNWRTCLSGWQDAFLPADNAEYLSWPSITDLFPWQASGVQLKRSWPVGETREVLAARWSALVGPLPVGQLTDDKNENIKRLAQRRAVQLKESADRKATSSYGDLFSGARMKPLASLTAQDEPPQVRRYAFRSFDLQWVIADTRIGDRMRPALWGAHGDHQVYMTSMLTEVLGEGPAAVATAEVPDLHHFRGSFGGRHVIPLWKDGEGTIPNITGGLLAALASALGEATTAADLFAYCYALLATPTYVETFWEELTIPGPHIPITSDPGLFVRVAEHGKRLIELHTFGARKSGLSATPFTPRASYTRPISANLYPETIHYDPSTETLTVGDGEFSNVSSQVWAYEVSGLKVVDSWLGYRLKKRSGKTGGSPLDELRPSAWPDLDGSELLTLLHTLEQTIVAQDEGSNLLRAVLESELIVSTGLPSPTAEDRAPLGADDEDEELDDADSEEVDEHANA
jgi:hypothetical protein